MSLDHHVAEFLTRQEVQAYLTGGSARDMLMKRPSRDIDITVVGDASQLARKLANELGGAFYQLDEEFDVARVLVALPDGTRSNIDLARQRGNSIQDDLTTRDFALNAIALPLASGQWIASVDAVVDPFNGLSDLAASQIRAIRDDVFQNDPVRLLRAVRLAAMLGMSIHPETATLVRRDAELLSRGAAERNREEFLKILGSDKSSQIILELDDLGLLMPLVPELAAARGCTQSSPHTFDVLMHSIRTVKEIEVEQGADYADIAGGKFASELKAHFESDIASEHSRRAILRLSGLLHDIGKPATRTLEPDGRIRFLGHEDVGADLSEAILRRLRFSNAEIELVRAVVKHHLRPLQLSQHSPVSKRAIYRFFRDTGGSGLDVCVHAWADQQAKSEGRDAAIDGTLEELFSAFFDSQHETIAPEKLVDGRDIMAALHLLPGSRVGEILNAVKEAQVEGEIRDRAQALEWIKRYDDK